MLASRMSAVGRLPQFAEPTLSGPEADVRMFKSRHPDQSIDICRDPQTSAFKTKVRGQRIREITTCLRIRAARASSASMN
jgi:hypothetical protein